MLISCSDDKKVILKVIKDLPTDSVLVNNNLFNLIDFVGYDKSDLLNVLINKDWKYWFYNYDVGGIRQVVLCIESDDILCDDGSSASKGIELWLSKSDMIKCGYFLEDIDSMEFVCMSK